MNATSSELGLVKTFNLPYQLGIYLAANAVQDVCVVVDGADCVMSKIDFVSGNHDLHSTLLSPEGRHRVICSQSKPLQQEANPDNKLSALLAGVASAGDFAAVLVTGMPFSKLAGVDYEGLAAAVKCGAPVVDVPAGAPYEDWLEGYALSLEALARALPRRKLKRKKRSVALVGYLMDRGECDHSANIDELRRLLGLCGLELACVFPSGGNFGGLSRALEAEVVVSLPYGRKAAATIAARSGARLVETGLPMGLRGTSRWLEAVSAAAGLRGALPAAAADLEKRAAHAISPALEALSHRNVLYAGDPYLFAAFASFAAELRMRVTCAFFDSYTRPLGISGFSGDLFFAPTMKAVLAAIKDLKGYRKPDLAVGNSFAFTEGMAAGLPFTELGFPSYGHHCLGDEPFLGYAGARTLAGRLLNSQLTEEKK